MPQYTPPKTIIGHEAVETCESGAANASDYAHDILLREGWAFENGNTAGTRTLLCHKVRDFKFANPVKVKVTKPKKAVKKAASTPADPRERPAPAVKSDPTKATYDTLSKAFAYFNANLFHDKLPPVMLVMHRKRNAHGYFWRGVWGSAADEKAELSEIALNPESMGRNPKEVLSTLVHEMVHHEQHVFGKPSKSGHNVEWGEWMARVGLTPVGVGNCAGKKSGRNFTHEIVVDGLFDKLADAFLARDDIDMTWFSKTGGRSKKKQDFTKVKHTCGCGNNLWGRHKPDAEDGNITATCGDCDTVFEPVFYA